MKELFSPKAKVISVVAGISLVTILATTAFALSNISLTLGSTQYDFGDGNPIPATVQIHVFTMKPGDTIPWHFHKAPSYVILKRGTLTEQHYDQQTGQCGSEQVTAVSQVAATVGQGNTQQKKRRGRRAGVTLDGCDALRERVLKDHDAHKYPTVTMLAKAHHISRSRASQIIHGLA